MPVNLNEDEGHDYRACVEIERQTNHEQHHHFGIARKKRFVAEIILLERLIHLLGCPFERTQRLGVYVVFVVGALVQLHDHQHDAHQHGEYHHQHFGRIRRSVHTLQEPADGVLLIRQGLAILDSLVLE